MSTHTNLRPRALDVSTPIPVIINPDQELLKEIEQESSHYTEIKQQRKKRKKDGLEKEEADQIESLLEQVETERITVPIPRIEEVTDEAKLKNGFHKPPGLIVYKEPSTDELYHKVEYDLESDDEDFLEAFNAKFSPSSPKNSKKKKPEALTEGQLESFIDLFEKESYNAKFSLDSDIISLFQFCYHDTFCNVCGEGEHDNSDAIVSCDMCGVAVHQTCYGIPSLPNGRWYCRKCEFGEKHLRCLFCPVQEGAVKKTVDNKWSHVSCALWIPQLSFHNAVHMEPIIHKVNSIPKKNWNVQCSICQQKAGVCIECSDSNCKTKFHITCARHCGYSTKIQRNNGTVKFVQYCRAHSMKIELEKDNPFGFTDLDQHQLSKLRFVVDNSGRNLQEIPTDQLLLVYKYWILKRKYHPAPLLRRFQVLDKPSKINLPDMEAYKRMRKLRQDFEKLRLLVDLVKKREILKRDYVNVIEDTITLEGTSLLNYQEKDKLANERRRQIKMQTQYRQRTQQQAAKLLAKAKLDINHKTKNGHVSLTSSTGKESVHSKKSMLSRITKKQPISIKSKRKASVSQGGRFRRKMKKNNH